MQYIISVGVDSMNGISEELINEIRSNVDIVDVISNYISLTPRGKNYFGICPFHDDNRPSMSVSKEKQIYKCFSCGATGNVFKFIMDYENISFVEAVKKCADMANIKLDIKVKNHSFDDNKNKQLYEIYDLSSKFYQNLINTDSGVEAKTYLHNRDINESLIKEFKVGLSLKDRNMLIQFLTKKGYSKSDLLKSGLIIENSYGLSDIYCNRIMFPLEDLQGRIVGFSGRIYNSTDNSKYINTKETEIFKKGEILYNYVRAKDEARNKGYVIVMEGFMDVIRSYTVGIKNVIAMMGTAVTKNQAMTIKKMAKEVILCFDGDQAGAHATYSCIDELVKIGVTPKIIRLEENLDPDEYIKTYGKEKFVEKIENPINVMDFKLSYLKQNKNINNSEELANYINESLGELSKIDDSVLREISLKKLSIESKLDIEFLKERLNSITTPIKEKEITIKKERNINNKLNGYQKAEAYLVYYMLQSKDVIKIYDKRVTYISNEEISKLAREISAYYHNHGDIVLADFLSYVTNYPTLNNTVGRILNLNLKDEINMDVINDYVNKIRENVVNIKIRKLKEKINNSMNEEEKIKLGEQIRDLKMQDIEH